MMMNASFFDSFHTISYSTRTKLHIYIYNVFTLYNSDSDFCCVYLVSGTGSLFGWELLLERVPGTGIKTSTPHHHHHMTWHVNCLRLAGPLELRAYVILSQRHAISSVAYYPFRLAISHKLDVMVSQFSKHNINGTTVLLLL